MDLAMDSACALSESDPVVPAESDHALVAILTDADVLQARLIERFANVVRNVRRLGGRIGASRSNIRQLKVQPWS